jgi:hypothetical protein
MIACFKAKDGKKIRWKLPGIKIGCCIGVTMESQLGQQKSFIFYALSLQGFGRISRADASLKILSFISIKNKSLKAVICILA